MAMQTFLPTTNLFTGSGPASVNDTPILLRSELDGSDRAPLYEFPQGTSLAVWNWDSGFASDGRNPCTSPTCQISGDPAVPDRFFSSPAGHRKRRRWK